MSVTINCQECRKPIKLLQPATSQTPISCCHCGAVFFLQPIETAPVDELVSPLGSKMEAEIREPGFRGLEPLPPLTLPDRPLESPAAPPIAFIPLKPPAPPQTANLGEKLTSAPMPMVIAEDDDDDEDGFPAAVDVPRHLQRSFRTNWMESLLGATLLLAVIAVMCATGFVIWRAFRPTTNTPTTDSQAVNDVEIPTVARSKELPRPPELIGFWTSRCDDGSHSALHFREDGQVVVYSIGAVNPLPTLARWYFVGMQGRSHVLEIGSQLSAPGNYLFYLDFTCPDAFVVSKTVRFGDTVNNDVRYVRSKLPANAIKVPDLPP